MAEFKIYRARFTVASDDNNESYVHQLARYMTRRMMTRRMGSTLTILTNSLRDYYMQASKDDKWAVIYGNTRDGTKADYAHIIGSAQPRSRSLIAPWEIEVALITVDSELKEDVERTLESKLPSSIKIERELRNITINDTIPSLNISQYLHRLQVILNT